MTDFELFVLYKEVLIAAENVVVGNQGHWEHVPKRDRMIGDDIEFAFSLKKDGKEIAVMEIRFDKSCYCGKTELACKDSLVKSGVAIFENADVHRALKASDIPLCKIEDLFDPMRMIYYGKDAEAYYAELREKW